MRSVPEVLVIGTSDRLEGLECLWIEAVDRQGAKAEDAPGIDANEGEGSIFHADASKRKKHHCFLQDLRRKLLRLCRHSKSFSKPNDGWDDILHNTDGDPTKEQHGASSVATVETASMRSQDSLISTWSVNEDDTVSVADRSCHEKENDIPLIQQRLLEYNGVEASHFAFVPDRVSKEVIAELHTIKNDTGTIEDDGPAADHDHHNNVTHVKTGIWQVTKLNDDGTPQAPFFVVTAVTMDDTVDTKKLRKALFVGAKHKRRPKLAMAETSIAEKLVGFRSGTMAPICHSTPMKLYMEESIFENAMIVDRDDSLATCSSHRLNVGSGMFGKCLSIDLDKFLEIAKSNEFGMELVSIKKKRAKALVSAKSHKQ